MTHLKVEEIEGKAEAYFDAETLARLSAVAGALITIDDSAIALWIRDNSALA